MIRHSKRFQRGVYTLVFLAAAALVLFSVFGFIVVKTNVNIISSGISAVKTVISSGFGEAITKIEQSISKIYLIVIAETITFAAGAVLAFFLAIFFIKNYFSIFKLSLVDELTGLYNRRAVYKFLDNEIKRAKRFKHPLTIIMADIDFFKIYNDKNGHVAGDNLLQEISKIMSNEVRDIDIVGRYGGEEFIVILPETSHEGASKIAERIRKKVEQTYFGGQETQPHEKVTISLGLTTFHGEYKERTQFIHSADELLYKAKEAGRNVLIREYYKDSELIKHKK